MKGNQSFNAPRIIFTYELSKSAKLIYLCLCSLADEEYKVCLTREEIGRKCSMQRNAVGLAISELKKAGLIEESRKRRGMPNTAYLCNFNNLLEGKENYYA